MLRAVLAVFAVAASAKDFDLILYGAALRYERKVCQLSEEPCSCRA